MLGLEMMFQKMLGMTPEEMAQKAKDFEAFTKGIAEGMVSLAETQKQILARLEAMENGPGK